MAPLLELPKSFSRPAHNVGGPPLVGNSSRSALKTETSCLKLTDLYLSGTENGLGDLNEIISNNKRLREAALRRNGKSGGQIVFGQRGDDGSGKNNPTTFTNRTGLEPSQSITSSTTRRNLVENALSLMTNAGAQSSSEVLQNLGNRFAKIYRVAT